MPDNDDNKDQEDHKHNNRGQRVYNPGIFRAGSVRDAAARHRLRQLLQQRRQQQEIRQLEEIHAQKLFYEAVAALDSYGEDHNLDHFKAEFMPVYQTAMMIVTFATVINQQAILEAQYERPAVVNVDVQLQSIDVSNQNYNSLTEALDETDIEPSFVWPDILNHDVEYYAARTDDEDGSETNTPRSSPNSPRS